mmetsp:Transcript_124954/g.347898  ORF Transcript_124954/g.347898 Transcript_124954/m.347898 type:complete len:229 (-) Transcript_124954:75-761(-)
MLQEILSGLDALSQLLDPGAQRFLACLKRLIDRSLLVPLVVAQDEAMRADRLSAIQAIEAELLVGVLVAQHPPRVVDRAINYRIVDVNNVVGLEEALGVRCRLALLAEYPIALDATPGGRLLLAEAAYLRLCGDAVARLLRCRVVAPRLHDDLQRPVHTQAALRQRGDLAAHRALDPVPDHEGADVLGADVVRALQHHGVHEVLGAHGTSQLALQHHGSRLHPQRTVA